MPNWQQKTGRREALLHFKGLSEDGRKAKFAENVRGDQRRPREATSAGDTGLEPVWAFYAVRLNCRNLKVYISFSI